MEQSSIIMDHQFDQETLDRLIMLREIRIKLIQKQLADAQKTIEALVSRGLIPVGEQEEHLAELKDELQQKLDKLVAFAQKRDQIHLDEIQFYLDMLD